MIGNGYWSTGISVWYAYSGQGRHGWAAKVEYYDDGFCSDDADTGQVSTEGTLRTEGELGTRYAVQQGEAADALTVVIDVIKADAERLGIRWGVDRAVPPSLYYRGDGEDENYPPPDGWRETLAAQSERIGWRPLYVELAPEVTSGDPQ
jgi:hypothetical protein